MRLHGRKASSPGVTPPGKTPSPKPSPEEPGLPTTVAGPWPCPRPHRGSLQVPGLGFATAVQEEASRAARLAQHIQETASQFGGAPTPDDGGFPGGDPGPRLPSCYRHPLLLSDPTASYGWQTTPLLRPRPGSLHT